MKIDTMNNWIPKLIVFFLIVIGCNTLWTEPTYNHWEWAECLPSLTVPAEDCPGDKPSILIYNETGQIGWAYIVDKHNKDEIVCYDMICLNYYNEQVGTTFNVPHWELPHMYWYHPITGRINKMDSLGYYVDTIWIAGHYDKESGRVAPKW